MLASSDSDKSDECTYALFPILMESAIMMPSQLMITTISEVPPDCGIIVSLSGHAVMDDSNDETKISTC
jgi:hypothetical protein